VQHATDEDVSTNVLQICVTLYEWEHITERFEKATHYAEKALLKVLVHDIIPVVAEQLRVLFLFSLIQF
jgi:hypothetical protein